jgi:hypothetical protein
MKTIHVKAIYDYLKDESFVEIQDAILELLPEANSEDEIFEFDISITNIKKLKPDAKFQDILVEVR